MAGRSPGLNRCHDARQPAPAVAVLVAALFRAASVYPMYILLPMKTRLQRWGNSLGIRIPKAFAEETGMDTGSLVDLSVDSRGRLVIEPVRGPKYELSALLDGITDENLHTEVSTGRRRGREAW